MAPMTVYEWRCCLSDTLLNSTNDISANLHDSAVAYEIYRFNRIHDLERTLEMRKTELEEILERVNSDHQKKLELDELFASLDAEDSQMKPNAADGQNTKLEGLEEHLVHKRLQIGGDAVSNRNYLYEWLGIAAADKEGLEGLKIDGLGLGDVEIARVRGTEEGAVNGLENLENE
ncbi:uncharacterized protein LAJ45_06244 [Morchella importuna]|uniref:uncharacterized protein n=1 Tax=Morchella importuna TaxID=1174673 RepID=UPI001E8CA37A|nr:uncharacterized protein LAJ45_06244 [Morchella importuna]KAH8149613.1 hypothetical protein LAJ45_06244 [Morchella importuna]